MFLLLLGLRSSEAHAYQSPSFSCDGKVTVIEKVICDFNGLSNYDGLLAISYRLLHGYLSESEAEELKQEQRAWLQQRDHQCPPGKPSTINSDTAVRALMDCLDKLYRERLKELDDRILSAAARKLKEAGPNERFAPGFWGVHLPAPPMGKDERPVADDPPYGWHFFAVTNDGSFLISYVYSTETKNQRWRHFNVYSSKSRALVFHEVIRANSPDRVGPDWFNTIWDNIALAFDYPERYGKVRLSDGRTVKIGRSGTAGCAHSYDGFVEVQAADGTVDQRTSLIAHRAQGIPTPTTICSEQMGTDDVEEVNGWFTMWGSSKFSHILDLADGSYLLLSQESGTLIRCTDALVCPWATPANGVYSAPYATIEQLTAQALLSANNPSVAIEHMDEVVRQFFEQE